MPLSAGTRLGPYEIIGAIGAGGMGEVYRASDPRLGRDVAIKVLPPGFSTDPERRRRFEQEAHAAAALNHPNILAVHDIGQHDGAPYIVSELLDGDTLRTRLMASAMPVRKAVEHAIQIAHGLAAAHEKGIVHRDLKPENIFITLDGHVKILDFGLAKLTQPETAFVGASALPTATAGTDEGTILGTLGYMSPEQVRGLQVDARADIFAFGAVLYEMLSGVRAFRKDTRVDTITAILKDNPSDLPVVERHIPPGLVRIVDRCLEKNPPSRFQSASDLGFALDALSSQTETIVAAGVTAPARRWPIAWTLFAVALVTALALGALTYVQRSASEAPALQSTILPPPDTTITDRGGATLATPARRLALSPDGQRLAFTAAGPDRIIRLWVRRLDALTAQRLEGTEGAVYPFWSPDSRYIGFFSEGPPRRSKLMKIDVFGGPPIMLCELTGTNSNGGTWNREGAILFGTFNGPPEGLAIHRVSSAGGTPSAVTKIDANNGETRHYAPYFLPDGRHFLYLAVGVKGGDPSQPNGQYVGSLDSDQRTRLMPGGSNAKYANGQLFFMRDTTLMAQPFDPARLELREQAVPVAEQVLIGGGAGGVAGAFTVSDNGRLAYQSGLSIPSQLRWFDRDGKQIGVLGEPGLEGFLALSPDGSRAAVTAFDESAKTADIWVYDVARNLRTRFTYDAANWEIAPVWSQDGERIVFGSTRQGVVDMYVKSTLGAGAEELLFSSDQAEQPISWSPDGRFLAFMSSGKDVAIFGTPFSADVRVLPLFGDRTPVAFLQSRFVEAQAHFSPDGRWMAYVSTESGRAEVYVAPFPGPGGRVPISTAGGTQPRWRRDGAEIFYVAGNRLMAAAVNGQRATFEVGAARPLFEIRPRTGLGPFYDVSADGQRFLVNTMVDEGTSTPITLVVNWPALLRK